MDDLSRAAAPRPASPTRRWLRALEMTDGLDRDGAPAFPDVIAAQARLRPEAPALLSDVETYTYGALDARANRYARWALGRGLGRGRVVALMLENRPDYLAAWIGLTRAGATVALLNSHLREAALAHCVGVAGASAAIVSPALAEDWAAALPEGAAPPVVLHGVGGLDADLDRLSGAALEAGERVPLEPGDRALLIYTSGTTGLPKAAVVSHRRIMTWSHWFAGLAAVTPQDRIYDCLPLYHSVGGVVAPGCVLAAGGSVVIRDGFSARRFWDDVAAWDCTVVQYIGELCRYLVAAPEGQRPAHRLRLALGNGLRPDVWERFRDRFGIPEILEFYAATEGSFSLSNVEGRVGSVGRVPPFLKHRFPAAVLRRDPETGEPLRGADGFCLRAAPGEAGEAVGLVGGGGPAGTFEGYTDPREGERKILRDVFAPGDRWFRTGDLMRTDAAGFFYFVDRLGDTFRWKGENVATTEVAEAISRAPGVVEATVYGVAVPGQDGRAGMAAIVAGEGFSLAALRSHLDAALPAYARPVFLRLGRSIAATETFKHRKGPLVEEGFDPRRIADPLYLSEQGGPYRALDEATFERVLSGAVRL